MDSSLAGLHHSEDGLQCGGLAGSVAAEQTDHLAFVDLQVDSLENVHRAVVGVDTAELEHRSAVAVLVTHVAWLVSAGRPR